MSGHRLLIGGELAAGEGTASTEKVDAAIAAARESFDAWSTTPAGDRCEFLHEVARRLRESGVQP